MARSTLCCLQLDSKHIYVTLFMPRFRLRRDVMVPSFIGIVPVSLFHAKSRAVRLPRRVNEPVSRPDRLLWSSLRDVRRLSPPMASGIAPTGDRQRIAYHAYRLYVRGGAKTVSSQELLVGGWMDSSQRRLRVTIVVCQFLTKHLLLSSHGYNTNVTGHTSLNAHHPPI